MANKRDYYEVVGVTREATVEEIKVSYRRKVKECHPDLHPNDDTAESRFKELNEAYEILCDDNKRARYDQFGHAGVDGNGGSGFDGFGGGFGGFSFDGFDIFDTIFGGGGRRQQNGPRRGNDREARIEITFEEAAFGVKKEFSFDRVEQCETCDGSGAKKGTEAKTCGTCKGTGTVQEVRSNGIFGQVIQQRPCGACGGTGTIIEEKCETCNGKGRVQKKRKVTVSIPAGIDDGQAMTLQGEGDAGIKGGPAGNLVVGIRVKPHKFFQRDGYDLFCEVPLTITQAALGGEIDIPTLEGLQKQMIEEGTQPGTQLRLRGKGIQRLRGGGKGDLFVNIRVDVPRKLSDEQKQLLRDLDASMSGKEYETHKSFFERMKDYFTQ